MRRRAFAWSCAAGAVMVSVLAMPTSVRAQDKAPTFFAVEYERAFIDSSLPAWTDWRFFRVLGYQDFDGGTLGLQADRGERFGLIDETVAVDAFANLWSGSYANLRVTGTPNADVSADWTARFEVFQVFGGAWEGALTLWHMDFPTGDVEIVGGALARYEGNWYLRARSLVSRSTGETAASAAVSARRFLRTPRESIEFSAGTGKEVVLLGAGPLVDLRQTSFAQVAARRFLTTHLGLSILVSYNTFEGAPSRLAAGVGLMARFGKDSR